MYILEDKPIRTIFLAGGISNCADWQEDAANQLDKIYDVVINPRSPNLDMSKVGLEAKKQIEWEHRNLKRADAILFWFAPETIQPIVLFELGRWLATSKTLFIGVHPDYERSFDVVQQVRLERPNQTISLDLQGALNQATRYHREYLG